MYYLVGILFSLMAFRAFRSGSRADIVLGCVQCVGILLLLVNLRQLGAWLLLVSAVAYLVSQILTGARLASRLLPVAGAGAAVLAIFG